MNNLLRVSLIVWFGFFGRAIAASADTNRIDIAVLAFENGSNAQQKHYQKFITAVLESKLQVTRSVRVIPRSSIIFAFREVKPDGEKNLTLKNAQKLGRVIEANRVVWGQYHRISNTWKISVQVMNVSSGRCFTNTVMSSNLDEACSGLASNIFENINVRLSSDERNRMHYNWSNSEEALEQLSVATEQNNEDTNRSEVEATLRRAISEDPKCVQAHEALAMILMAQGKLEASEQTARKAIGLRSDSPVAHSTLGFIHLMRGEMLSAQEQYLEATRIAPDKTENYIRLGEIAAREERWEEMVTFFEKAANLAPFDGATHAQLGRAYAKLGKRDPALAELHLSERYELSDPSYEQVVAQGYEWLNEIPDAIQHYERFFAEIKKMGAWSPDLETIEKNVTQLKNLLTCHFVIAPVPANYKSDELNKALRDRLAAADLPLVTDPFRCTTEMKRWAHDLTDGTDDGLEKARRLFNGLTRRSNGTSDNKGRRTAVEVFKEWSDSKASFTCQEYTFLYAALARAVGLNVNYVLVRKDYDGRYVTHACAGFVVTNRVVLIDPQGRWFGAPHKDYQMLDDVQAIAIYLCQVADVHKNQIATKLFPNYPLVHFNLAMTLAGNGNLSAARTNLGLGLKLDSESWMALYTQGMIEAHGSNWNAAAQYFQRCLKINPQFPEGHFFLGKTLLSKDKVNDAREEYRKYLSMANDPELADEAREVIAYIKEPPLR